MKVTKLKVLKRDTKGEDSSIKDKPCFISKESEFTRKSKSGGTLT